MKFFVIYRRQFKLIFLRFLRVFHIFHILFFINFNYILPTRPLFILLYLIENSPITILSDAGMRVRFSFTRSVGIFRRRVNKE